MPTFSDIESAFSFVSSAPYGMNTALLRKDTGEILYCAPLSDVDEISDKEEELNWDACIEIPHKNDLDLGQKLVFEFVEENLPGAYERVRNIFSKGGAYSRFKELLNTCGLLQAWYDFENQRQEQAL